MPEPRLRIFGGPNGSGKSTLFDSFSKKYNAGIFLNADLIENELATKGYVDLSEFNLKLTQKDLNEFLKTERALSLIKKSFEENHHIKISLKENIIVNGTNEAHSYEGALISSFLRHHLQEKKIDFCFETVMSHPSKIEEIKEAKKRGYKTYLYFICIDDPEVNISRVENRVEKGGHNVAFDKISSRYYKTLESLIEMIEIVDKCYLFDNSSEKFKLIAKIVQNQLLLEVEQTELPNWFNKYVLKYYSLDKIEEEIINDSGKTSNSIEYELNKNNFSKDHFLEINFAELRDAFSALRSINNNRQKILPFIYIEGSVTLTDIYINLKIEQSLAARHLAILIRGGIVVSFKEGKFTYYRINLEKIKVVAQAIKLINDVQSDT